jgi:hypothetical protein
MTSQNLAAASDSLDEVYPPRFEASIAPQLRKAFPLTKRVDRRSLPVLDALARIDLQSITSFKEEQ